MNTIHIRNYGFLGSVPMCVTDAQIIGRDNDVFYTNVCKVLSNVKTLHLRRYVKYLIIVNIEHIHGVIVTVSYEDNLF